MTPPRRRALTAGALLATVAALAGCGDINAGTGAETKFISHMAGTPGVLAAEGFMSNDLPFNGSGDLIVALDPSADEQTLDAALEHAMTFRVPSGVHVYRLVTRMAGADGQIDDLDDNTPGIRIETYWGEETDGVAGRALDLSRVPALYSYDEQLDDLFGDDPTSTSHTVIVGETDFPCLIVHVVAAIAGTDVTDISAQQGDEWENEDLSCR
ncbi:MULTISPECIES: hypothetical protein [unclassified Microbacterium]|uniref:hypothetical protein n=1 Tax=unclassified Microbacterium TaxID=2609290 RepID=UPI0012F869F8|nr:hypothetical protein [Microbacterium sp. MAH-37]MVQ41549.1 hypothetical protein [Microbacterium sp. MAH-37]